MGLRINTNMSSMITRRVLGATVNRQEKSFQRLASGQRITSAADDAAGLSISENFRAQIRSLHQAKRNAGDGMSLVQVAEGGLTEVGNILIRLRELSIQAANDTLSDKERSFINQEFQSLLKEVDRISNVTTFNGVNLLNGEGDKTELQLQVGIRNNEADRILFNLEDFNVKTDALGVEGISSSTIDEALESLDQIDEGLSKVMQIRASLGAMQNKLQATSNNLGISIETLSRARSRIADTDVADETSALVRENILQSAGVAVLAQANQQPLQALKLL